MLMGSFGPVIFSVDSLRVLNFKDFNRTAGKRTVQHEVISGKPRTEFLGADLGKVSFNCHFDVTYGAQPRMHLDLLRTMAETGIAYPLIIGGRPIGIHSWSLDSVSEEWGVVYSAGELVTADASLSLTEYVPIL